MPKHWMTRRELLRGALAAGGGLAGLSLVSPFMDQALASDGSPLESRNFIFCYFSGGWDILLGLDPRDPQKFRDDNRADTLIQPAYDLQDEVNLGLVETGVDGMVFGPYIGKLAEHAHRLAVVRGMSMDTLTHDAGRRRFLTGKPPSGILARGSSLSAVLSAQLGEDTPIPNISGNVESFNVDQPTFASALGVANVEDLLRSLREGEEGLGSLEKTKVQELLNLFQECQRERRSKGRVLAHESRRAAVDLVSSGLDGFFDFQAPTSEMVALKAKYGMDTSMDSPEALSAMAVTAITNQISRCASIRVAFGLDTHFDNWLDEQGPRQQQGFDMMATMASDLASRQYKDTSDSWLDHTTLVGFSEFSRTALLNSNSGRDHSLTNAAVLMGAGIRGGQILGASSDVGMNPQAMNLETGLVDQGGEIVRPEHIHRALLHGLGITEDIADLRVDPLMALLS